jgi:diguanylate cyclase (GGDEF)-like protein
LRTGGGGACTTVTSGDSEIERPSREVAIGVLNRSGTVMSAPSAPSSTRPLATGTSLALMKFPLLADNSPIGRQEGVLKAVVESFKLKLAAYFTLISLLPLAAAFWGFDAVTERAETNRADSVLQVTLRSVLATYTDALRRLEDSAEKVARDPAFQRALREKDEQAVRRALRGMPGVRVETTGLNVGRRPDLSVERSVEVTGARRSLGSVVASLPIDLRLTRRLARHSGLDSAHRVVFLSGDRVAAGEPALRGRVDPADRDPRTASLGSERYRLLASEPLPALHDVRVAILTRQSRIDAAVTAAEGRVFVPLLIALVLIALLAYIEGRSIVRTLGGLVEAAHGLAKGNLHERVPVKGKDEFAELGRAFNEMADQLEQRMNELDAERTRVRDATMRFGEALAATHDPAELLRVIVETAVEGTGAEGGYLDSTDGFDLAAGDVDFQGEELRLPVTTERETFGTLVLVGRRFGKEQRETAAWLVGHAAIALANVRKHKTVEQQALIDPLTGLANRRLAEGALENELARAGRFDGPLALVMTDLDDFKQINDRWGHPFGDEVLREFASVLSESIRREIDLASRWGGEEFAIMLPETDVSGAVVLAERIRASLRKRTLRAPDGELVRITASFGAAAYPDARSKDELVSAADTALYDAKRGGKDQVAGAALVGDSPSAVA